MGKFINIGDGLQNNADAYRSRFDTLNRLMENAAEHLEQYAAAFLKETGLPATEVELVVYPDAINGGFVFRFRKRSDDK